MQTTDATPEAPPQAEDNLTPGQLAKRLGVSVSTVDRRRRAGQIPFARVGGRSYRYSLADVRAALAKLGPASPPRAT